MKKIIKALFFAMLIISCLSVVSCAPGGGDTCEHEWGEWAVQRAATCDVGGYSLRICSLCDAEDRQAQYATGHTYSSDWESDGLYHWYGATCQHEDQTQGRGSHTFVNNACSVCGREKVTQGLNYIVADRDALTIHVSGIGEAVDANIIVGTNYQYSAYEGMYRITGIADSAFYGASGIKSVYMRNNILTIGSHAFAGIDSLTEVSFTNSVTYIGEGIFDGCAETVTLYFEGTEEEWNGIVKDVNWNSGITLLRLYVRLDGEWREINENCEHSFGEWALEVVGDCLHGGYGARSCTKCSAKQTMPAHIFSQEWSWDQTYHWRESICGHNAGVTAYAEHTFINNVCTGCGRERVSQGLAYRGNLGEDTYTVIGIGTTLDADVSIARRYNDALIVGIADEAFRGTDGLVSIYMLENIVTIGDYAFADCADLTEVTIGSGVEYIGVGVFSNSPSLTKIIFAGTRAEWNAIEKAEGWDEGLPEDFVIECIG